MTSLLVSSLRFTDSARIAGVIFEFEIVTEARLNKDKGDTPRCGREYACVVIISCRFFQLGQLYTDPSLHLQHVSIAWRPSPTNYNPTSWVNVSTWISPASHSIQCPSHKWYLRNQSSLSIKGFTFQSKDLIRIEKSFLYTLIYKRLLWQPSS